MVLGLAELGLRAAGAGYPAGFFVPVRGQRAEMTNPRFGWRFFPPGVQRREGRRVAQVDGDSGQHQRRTGPGRQPGDREQVLRLLREALAIDPASEAARGNLADCSKAAAASARSSASTES